MAVFNLGVPAQVIYRATNYRSDLTDVHAIVLRPDGRQVFLELCECNTPFSGVYTAELITTPADPEGDWLVQIISLQDGRKDVTRMTYLQRGASQESVDALMRAVQNLNDVIEVFLL